MPGLQEFVQRLSSAQAIATGMDAAAQAAAGPRHQHAADRRSEALVHLDRYYQRRTSAVLSGPPMMTTAGLSSHQSTYAPHDRPVPAEQAGPAQPTLSLGLSDGIPLKGSPNMERLVLAGAASASPEEHPACSHPYSPPPPEVEADRELAALAGVTPAPLGRNVRKWQLRESGAAVQDTPAPLARGASQLSMHLGPGSCSGGGGCAGLSREMWAACAQESLAAVAGGKGHAQQQSSLRPIFINRAGSRAGDGSTVETAAVTREAAGHVPDLCAQEERASLPMSAKEALFRPLGGGVHKYGMLASPGKATGSGSLHNASTLANLPLAIDGLAPGSSAALPSRHAQGAGASACVQGDAGIPELPLRLCTVGGTLQGLKQGAQCSGLPELPAAPSVQGWNWPEGCSRARQEQPGTAAVASGRGYDPGLSPLRAGRAGRAGQLVLGRRRMQSSHGSSQPSPVRPPFETPWSIRMMAAFSSSTAPLSAGGDWDSCTVTGSEACSLTQLCYARARPVLHCHASSATKDHPSMLL
jgi:hypothetical protein